MKRILFIMAAVLLLTACGGRGNQRKAITNRSDTETGLTANHNADAGADKPCEVWSHEDIDWDNRQVFYAVTDMNDNFHVSKGMRMFIVDEKIVIEEIPHEPFIFAIKKFVRVDESNMYAILNHSYMGYQYYGHLLSGEKLNWMNTSRGGEQIMRLVKDESTLIWNVTYDDVPARVRYIDSYDVLRSGYYYQNQNTMFHDPDNEDFRSKERPALTGVFDLDETPTEFTADSETYAAMERPFAGKWLEITMTDIGYVVYDYPSLYDDGETHNPFSIEVDGDEITPTFPSDPFFSDKITQVMIYPDSGHYCFNTGNFYYSFRWIDRERHICEWTLYYSHGRIMSQDYFVHAAHNEFPVMMFDWD